MDQDQAVAIARAEAMIAAAIRILFPHCGGSVAVGVVEQMAKEQVALLALEPLLSLDPKRATPH